MKQIRFDHPGLTSLPAAALGAVLALAAGILVNSWRSQHDARAEAEALTGGRVAQAQAFLRRYGCSGCHEVGGVPGAHGKVGPSLKGLRQRVYIAGVVQNTPENLVRWIVDPQSLSPRSAMPATGISPDEARDVSAFLYAQ